DWTGKSRCRIRVSAKRNANTMSVLLIAIDDEQRPLAIGTLQSVGGDQLAASAVVEIGLGRIDLMLSAAGLRPLQVYELRHKELRQRLLNFVVSVNREHAKGARRIIAAGLHRQGQIVKVINAIGACVEQRSDVIRQPDARENVLI